MDIVNSKKSPLTPSQLDIFLDQQRTPHSGIYTIGGYFQLVGALDNARLLNAITQVVNTESAFHLHLDLTAEMPLQFVVKPEQIDIIQMDFCTNETDKSNAQTSATKWIESNFSTPFALDARLYQVALLKIAADEYWLYLKTHHLIMDGWSYSLFIQRVTDYYQNETTALPEHSWWEYIQTTNAVSGRTKDKSQQHKQYWQERFINCPPLPLLQRSQTTRAEQTSHTSIRHTFVISKAEAASLLHIAAACAATGFQAFLALFYCYFLRAYGTNDIVIGTPLHGRRNATTKKIIGMFAGTSPTRITAEDKITFAELLQQISQQLARDFRHQQYSLGQIHRDINQQGERRERLYDVFFSYENFEYSQFNTPDFRITPNPVTHRQDQTPFNIFIRQYADNSDFEFDLQLRNDFFTQSDVYWIEGRLRKLVNELAKYSTTPLHQLDWLPEQEFRALQTINHTVPPTNNPVHVLTVFKQAVEKNPQKMAVVGCDKPLSYLELDTSSTAFAHWLNTQGVSPGSCVGVSMDRTGNLLVVLLGIWKAGAAYIPLDPEYPRARLVQVIEHSQLQCVITQEKYSALFAEINIACYPFSPSLISQAASTTGDSAIKKTGIEKLDAEKSGAKRIGTEKQVVCKNDIDGASLQNLAYVIYTSGSTGIPKGVAIEHSSLANFLKAMGSTPGISHTTNLLAVTTISFDIHILELFLPLVSGATIVLANSEQTRDAFALQQLMQTHNVNMMQATPATWKMLFHADWEPDGEFKALCGGEALPPMLLEKFGRYPQVELWNMYGPTEATVWSSTALINAAINKSKANNAIHLGNPLSNCQYYVLDKFTYPAGFNLPGELYIGGECLAREYIHDAEKTAASFLSLALPGLTTQRLYKTGDSVELRDNHQLYFRSRNDDQVKVRGYRIELGDIESALMKHPAVKDAAVKIWRDARDENYLAAYCVAKFDSLTNEALIQHLQQHIPEYMLPASYDWLDALPLTPNGKVDRKQLAKPQLQNILVAEDVPATPLEKMIAAIWMELLAVANPHRQDDFFRLGGDSISNIQQVSRLRKQGIPAEAADIFRCSHLAAFAQLLSSRQQTLITPADERYLPRANEFAAFSLSSAQQRLYIVQQLEAAATAYNMYGAFLIDGSIDHVQLENAFTQLIQRHQPLHSKFIAAQGELLQQPVAITHFKLDLQPLPLDFSVAAEDWIHATLSNFVRPFDIADAPLVRAQLWQSEYQQPASQLLLVDMHHLVADGLSINIFLHELFALYEQQPLAPLLANYHDFIGQQSAWLASPAFSTAAEYWQQQFAGELTSLDFPTDFTRPAQQQFSGKRLQFSLTPALSKAIKHAAQEQGLSLFMYLIAAYNLLLSKYTGRDDIIVGTPVSDRPDENFDNLIGLFVNTLPLRNYPVAEKPLQNFLQEVKNTCSLALQHKHYPFEKLIDDLSLARDFSRNPLFDCALVLQTNTIQKIHTSNLDVQPLPVSYHQAKFDLTLDAVDTGTHIQFELEYATHLFKEERIQRLGKHFINLLQQMVAQPAALISALSLLDDEERHTLLHTFNNTEKQYPANQTLVSIFEQQVDKTPQQIAIGFANQHLSYDQLNKKSNLLAHHLIAQGIGKNQIVAVMLERSLEMPIAILAIIKAGAAYLPIAPNLPQERIEYILADSNAPVLISHTTYLNQIGQFSGHVIALDDETLLSESSTHHASKNPAAQSGPDDLAYVIYTSGSTGRPKGAMIDHRAVVNRIYWMQDKYPLTANDVILQKTPYTFDVSVWELFWWSFAGASVYFIAPEAEKDPQQIYSCISEQRISILHFVPSMLTASLEFLAAHSNNDWNLSSLRYVFASGEALSPHQVEEFNRHIHPVSGAQLINLYGPTEAAIDVSWFDCPISGTIQRVPIGKPIDNIRLYILDSQQQLVARGIAGELYISGIGVGRGYVNKPDLTAEKFLPDPFFTAQRMYRTGDLCRWLNDGNIEYLGRLDHQVKIRGYRIELGEIETGLLNHDALREAVVVALKNTAGQDYLCAYVVTRTTIAVDDLRLHLAETLPDYMVPAAFVLLEKMPLNPSGKVDRKQLPAPQHAQLSKNPDQSENPGQLENPAFDDASLNEKERQLLSIVRELLSNPGMGPKDNFFHAGGDSIRAIQLTARAAQAGLQLSIRDIFKYPDVQQLAAAIDKHNLVITNRNGNVAGPISLTPIQHAFFEQQLANPNIYCQYIVIDTPTFDHTAIRNALSLLLQQHPLLNARVVTSEKQSHQLHIPATTNSWEDSQFIQRTISTSDEHTISTHLEYLRTDLQTCIQLDSSLHAAGLLATDKQDYLVLMVHHLVIDGVSWRILLDDLYRFYHCLVDNKPVNLLPVQSTMLEWIKTSNAFAQSSYLQKQFHYWQKTQESIAPALIENPAPKLNTLAQSGTIKQELSVFESTRLLTQANEAYGTNTQDLLIAALTFAWQQWTGKSRVALDLEAHGRQLPFNSLDISRSINWFTAIFPWVFDTDCVNPIELLPQKIMQIKESLRQVPDKGIGYGLLKYAGSKIQQQSLRMTKPDVLFNFLGHVESGNAWHLHNSGLVSAAQNACSHLIEIIMAIKAGKLEWSIQYPTAVFTPHSIQQFNKLLQAQLLSIIEHCSNQLQPCVTPSDVGDANLPLATYYQWQTQFANLGLITAIHKLTPTQAGIFFHAKNHAELQTELYYEELGFYVNQQLVPEKLQTALDQLTTRHCILRSLFLTDDLDEPRQLVFENARNPLIVHDISPLEKLQQADWLQQLKMQTRHAGFDWQQPLLRLQLVHTDTQESMLLFSYHHIILDGWSCAALLEELLTTYLDLEKSISQQTIIKPPRPADFDDYLRWLPEQNPEPALDYWKQYLADITDKTRLPGEIELVETAYLVAETEYQLPGEYLSGLHQLATKYEVTLNTLLQTAWGLLLQSYNNSDEALFVSVVSGRTAPLPGIEKMLGLFINSIPVRVTAPINKQSPDSVIASWLQAQQLTHLQSEQHSFIGLAEIARTANLSTDKFRQLLVFENYPVNSQSLGDAVCIDRVSLFEQTHYDFNLLIQPGSGLNFRFIVNAHVHSAANVARIAEHLLALLRSWVDADQLTLANSVCTTDEIDELLQLGVAPTHPIASSDNLITRFLTRKNTSPSAPAVCDEHTQLTYAELADGAQRIAQHLLALGVIREQPIALLANRSCAMITALLGILQAGAVVVPIDPHLPEERIRYLLNNSAATIILVDETHHGVARELPELQQHPINHLLATDVTEVNLPLLTSSNLLYVIYTSGTTGNPKGVMLEHRNLLALIDSQKQDDLLHFNKQVLQFATHSFDVCYQEIFSTLLAGGCLHVIDEQLKKDVDYVLDFIRDKNIDTVFFPTAYLKFLFSLPERLEKFPACIAHIITAGEQLLVSPVLKRYLQDHNVLLHNHYGPSETHVVSTQVLSRNTGIDDIPSIGKPVAGTGIYLLDQHGKLQPRGAVGEIFIGGANVGRGYWNNQELSNQRFLARDAFYSLVGNNYFRTNNPRVIDDERIYRTGDLGYWSAAGELIYLGRADQQVKVRGYRIELGEIETCLRKQENVREAAVIACRDPQGENYLVAYLVLEANEETAINAGSTQQENQLGIIKRNLAAQLPAYMQPAFMVSLIQLPMTANGKLDRRALPPVNEPESHSDHRKPITSVQIRIASLWQQLLGMVHTPHLDADFFAVGGHSLNAASLTAGIAREWSIKLSIKELFLARTLEQQAELVAEKIAAITFDAVEKNTTQVKKEAENRSVFFTNTTSHHIGSEEKPAADTWVALSSAQQRLYVLDQLAGPNINYNIPFVARVNEGVDVQQLKTALQRLLENHSILRTNIRIGDGQPVQNFSRTVPAIQTGRIAAEELQNYLSNWMKPFDLHKDVLIRIELLNIIDSADRWLLLDIHHIIADGVSVEILLRDLLRLYRNEPVALPAYDYRTIVNWQNEWRHSADYQTQKQYWVNRFQHLPPVLELPLDFPRPPVRNTSGNEIFLPVDNAVAQKLEHFAQQRGTSVFALGLTAYILWLWRYSGETDMAIGIPVSGRSQAEFADVPGLMVNTLAFRTRLDVEQTVETVLQTIATQLLDDLQHQDYPFDALVHDLFAKSFTESFSAQELPRDPGRNALFDTMFSLGNDWLEHSGAAELFLPQPLPVTQAKFDLAMSLDLHQGQYALSVNYATSLFTVATAEQMGRHYLALLKQLLLYPQQKIKAINCLDVTEYQQLTIGFNNTQLDYARNSTIANEFEKIAASAGETLAVYDDEGSFNYRELNYLANQIAAYLHHQNVLPQTFVGVMLERSRYWLASMLGVLKAGAIYLPIAPEWPAERIRSIVQDAAAPLLICDKTQLFDAQNNTADRFHYLCKEISLDLLLAESAKYPGENITPCSTATDLAYAIYTSGSTGIPKGVLVEQRGVLNLARWAGGEYNLQQNTRVLQLTSPGFDVSIEETLVPLLNGASVFILDDEQKMDKQKFTAFIQQHHIQIAEVVPSLLGDYLLDNIPMESLALVITGAERLDSLLKDQILARGYRLHNVYGPTETTVNATSKSCTLDDDTIGRPMANSQAFILDQYQRVQAIGVPGELCISGDNLARGYHQRDELNSEKFVANPFCAGMRLYRTGDLAKWTSSGEIRFIGRIDQQIKIRGYRIEIGDIEHRLSSIDDINQAVITVRNQETANASLCAYYTGPAALEENELRKQLAQWLPDYMLPAHFIYLPAIPLTANGKVDKKALPQPELTICTEYQPPRTAVEYQLQKIWSNLLDGDNYSIDEDFFRVGGHSLLAIKLLAAINQQWNIALKLTDIFSYSVLEKMAALIEQHDQRDPLDLNEPSFSLLNPAAEKMLFLFPPALGESLIYSRLSHYLTDYRFYCFNYLDDPTRLDIYADAIEAAQTAGKIYLFGYSAGGNLAFEVARVLEARGRIIGDLILLDSVRRQEFRQLPERAQIELDIRTAFTRNQMELEDALLNQLIDQAHRYGIYIENLINSGRINAPLHLIKADEATIEAADYGWQALTDNLHIHAGRGEHLEMLAAGTNLEYNIRIINYCLEFATKNKTGNHSLSDETIQNSIQEPIQES